MSSFVSAIMQKADHMEKKAVHEQVDTLLHQLTELELEVHQLAEDKYVNFRPILNEAESLSNELQIINNDLSSAEKKINTEMKDQLGVSTGEFQSLNQQLSEARIKLSALEYLSEIHQLLEKNDDAVEKKTYSAAAVALGQLDSLLKQPLTSDNSNVPILIDMHKEFVVQRECLSCKLTDAWNSAISWNIQGDKPSRPNEVMTNVREVSLTVSCVGDAAQELMETVEGLYITGSLPKKMATLAKRVKDYLLPFIIEQTDFNMDVKTVESKNQKILTVSVAKPNTEDDPPIDDEDHYLQVFSNMLVLLGHLESMFLYVDYGWEESATMLNSVSSIDATTMSSDTQPSFKALAAKGTLMNLLGEEVSAELLDQVCRTVLAKAVPSSARDLEKFNAVVTSTQETHDALVKLGFIQPDNRILLEYVDNINALFANKKCQAILEQARDLMTSSLHESVAVAEDKPVGEWPPLLPGGVKKSKVPDAMGDHLSENTLRLPKCRISQNIDTLVQSAYETLKEATDSSPECAVQMYYAVRGMFETYCHIVPTHHSQSLEELPLVAVLHHNNCMFLAHHMLTLGHQFSAVLPSSQSPPTFMDLVPLVRQIGLEVFLKQISRQRSILEEALDGAKGFTSVEENANHERSERAIKQVLLQLSHLQKIWKPVLPINIYKKTMGQLIKSVVERITNSVSQLEDIAQEAGKTLISLLKPVEEECGQLVVSPGEIPAAELLRHVPRWSRLTELKMLLDAGLSDIGDRWAEGKGPLAAAFSPKEVRQMVRALFQNTDRRAAVLATIR